MPNICTDIQEFHEKFDLDFGSMNGHMQNFRVTFMNEELTEYIRATSSGDKEGQLDALVDLVYVAVGTAYLHGWNFQEAWDRVHAANMTKVRAQHAKDSKRGSHFDVVKPEGWVPPNLKDLVE